MKRSALIIALNILAFLMAYNVGAQQPYPLAPAYAQPAPAPNQWVPSHGVYQPYQRQPPQIYLPEVRYRPYQYMGSQRYQIQYPTPLRDLFFGRYLIRHQYSPQQ